MVVCDSKKGKWWYHPCLPKTCSRSIRSSCALSIRVGPEQAPNSDAYILR